MRKIKSMRKRNYRHKRVTRKIRKKRGKSKRYMNKKHKRNTRKKRGGLKLNEGEIITYILSDNVDAFSKLVTRGNLNVNTVINNIYEFSGRSLLYIAAKNNKKKIIKYLLDKGADPNRKTATNGFTPLYNAVVSNEIELIKMLLDGGADPNIKNNDGLAPLHDAVMADNMDVVKLLLDSNQIDVNVKMAGTNVTPLSIAIPKKNIKMIDLLLSAGANEPKIYKLTSEQVDTLIGEIEKAYPPETGLYSDRINIPYFRNYISNYMTQQKVLRGITKMFNIDEDPNHLYNYLKDKIEGYFNGYGFP